MNATNADCPEPCCMTTRVAYMAKLVGVKNATAVTSAYRDQGFKKVHKKVAQFRTDHT